MKCICVGQSKRQREDHSLLKSSIVIYTAEPRVDGGLVAASWKLDTLSTTDPCLFYMALDLQIMLQLISLLV